MDVRLEFEDGRGFRVTRRRGMCSGGGRSNRGDC